MILYYKLSTLFVFKISTAMIIFINFYSKFVFRKISIKSFVLIQCWVSIISPSSVTCNVLMISCLSQVTTSGSNPNFFFYSKNFFDDFLQLLSFLSTKPFRSNLLHGWNSVLGINSCLYFFFWITFIKNQCPISNIWLYF